MPDDPSKIIKFISNAFTILGNKLDKILNTIKKKETIVNVEAPIVEPNITVEPTPVKFPDTMKIEKFEDLLAKISEKPEIKEDEDLKEVKDLLGDVIETIKKNKPVVNVAAPKVEVEAPIVNVEPTPITVEPTPVEIPKEMSVEGLTQLIDLVANKSFNIFDEVSSKRTLPVSVMVNGQEMKRGDFGGSFTGPSVVGLKNNASKPALINPATEEKQDDIITAIEEIAEASEIQPTTEAPQAMIVDEVSAALTYQGWAVVGAATNAAIWRIRRISVAGVITTIDWADGDSNYDNVWDNRAALSYS